ncbi:MAG TPA: AMP-binding protein, partial [Vicinamibacterales bacterium]|nr:AMP-binding protein [Vicinamibacterales bacterium]
MPRRTLLDFLSDVTSTPSTAAADFLTYDDGYRTWTWTYAQLGDAARAFARRLTESSIRRGDAVAIWSENRPEWIAALWGCLLEGVALVPVDYRASPEFVLKVAGIVDARAIIVGDVVDTSTLGTSRAIWNASELREARGASRDGGGAQAGIDADTTAEIIFTSGATAEPKGVVLTHRNVLANIVPIEKEVEHYRRYIRLFSPIRFLNLLPLSHMFGQAMATFIPPMLPGLVVFTRSYAPQDVVRQIHDRRVSVLVCVPKMLEVLRDHVVRTVPEAADPPPEGMHWARRWWKYRRVHRMFGLKFWAMVVGAAPLDPELEAFWGRLGFAVVQGYGLTETAPIVTLNHPLRAARGAVGKPIPGVEVKIADDGEILVRGENVTRGYYHAPEATREAFEDGWFHTGDIGEFDERGQLHIKGRKKEMIVTPEGLNVFPEDVERALTSQAGVRDAAVVGAPLPGSTAERVQAVLVVDPGTDVDAVVRAANGTLADHQRIRAAVVWPEPELPRTEGTRKLKRRELRNWLVEAGGARSEGRETKGQGPGARGEGRGTRSVVGVLERFAPGRTITPQTTIEELGLSSLERVELMMALEEALQVTIDEASFSAATTVADVERITAPITGVAARGPVSPAADVSKPHEEA